MYKFSVCVVNIICVLYHDRSLRITITFLFRFISVRGRGGGWWTAVSCTRFMKVMREHKHNQLLATCCDRKFTTFIIFRNCNLQSLLMSIPLLSSRRLFYCATTTIIYICRTGTSARHRLDFHLDVTLTVTVAQHVGYTWGNRSSQIKNVGTEGNIAETCSM
jgi:hypothetical protein